MRLIGRIGSWFDARPQLGKPIRETAEHEVPRDSASWFYVFGSAALTALVTAGDGDSACDRLCAFRGGSLEQPQVLNHDIALGWFIRALHGWGSNFMVAIVLIHMVQVFLFGAYKYPRELTWMLGHASVGDARNGLTGQVLRFDQDAYWGLGLAPRL